MSEGGRTGEGSPSSTGYAVDSPGHVPTFALTFDMELFWGFFDLMSADEYAVRYPETRETYASLIRILERHEISATWAVVGHLFLSECRRDSGGCAHRGLSGPALRDGRSWYSADPCTSREADPLWYADDILDTLQAARTPQEIGCHSFGHVPYGHPDMTAEAVEADLSACVDAAARRGLALRSFVFPRNWEGHHDVLQRLGFRAYRGADPEWHRPLPRTLRRVAHVADSALAVPPPVSQPTERLPGLWNIPGSGLLAPRSGAWRLVPAAARVSKARSGLRQAIDRRAVFHLWTHPCNVATDERFMLTTLESILSAAAALRDRGEIAIQTMGAIADRMAAAEASCVSRAEPRGEMAAEPRGETAAEPRGETAQTLPR